MLFNLFILCFLFQILTCKQSKWLINFLLITFLPLNFSHTILLIINIRINTDLKWLFESKSLYCLNQHNLLPFSNLKAKKALFFNGEWVFHIMNFKEKVRTRIFINAWFEGLTKAISLIKKFLIFVSYIIIIFKPINETWTHPPSTRSLCLSLSLPEGQ